MCFWRPLLDGTGRGDPWNAVVDTSVAGAGRLSAEGELERAVTVLTGPDGVSQLDRDALHDPLEPLGSAGLGIGSRCGQARKRIAVAR